MKKFVYLIETLLFVSIVLNSCLKDEYISTSRVNYATQLDSIKFDDKNDSIWSNNIREALSTMKIINYLYEVRDTSNAALSTYSVYACNQKAGDIHDKALKALTLSDIKKTIYNEHADSLVKLGYKDGSESLPIDPFTIRTSLWSSYSNSMVFYFETKVK